MIGARRLRSALRRLSNRGPGDLARALRLTGAALASYLVALLIVTDTRPVTAALTALLVVQVTLVGTIADTIRRIVSVVAGVGLAITVSTVVGFTWWSLAAIVAASLLVGQLLRLGPHLLEVPISAMLILAVGGLGTQALDRVIETLVGAALGVLVNVVFPPAVQTRSAGAAVAQFAERIGQLLDRAAESLAAAEVSRDQAREWLDEARRITGELTTVDHVLTQAHESRRLNPRALGTRDTTPDLRSGLEALEHSAVALRAVFRSLADRAAPDDSQEPAPATDDDLRQAFATLMSDLAAAVRSFGALVRAEVDHAEQPHTEELSAALDALGEARARVTELLLVDPQQAPGLWQAHGSLLAGIERVLAELDVGQRTRLREQRRREADERRTAAAQAAERLRASAFRAVRDRR